MSSKPAWSIKSAPKNPVLKSKPNQNKTKQNSKDDMWKLFKIHEGATFYKAEKTLATKQF